jgi:cyclophilin family peptidyl-prolyl cis-trans isomerase/HEAT repeat protein
VKLLSVPHLVILARMMRRAIPFWILIGLVGGCKPAVTGVSPDVLVHILEAEDTRQWNETAMETHLADKDPEIRARAALAAGRIGDDAAIPRLAELLNKDASETVMTTAAFAIGEMESVKGAEPLLGALRGSKSNAVRASAVEGLGKIAAALPEKAAEDRARIGTAILDMLIEQQQDRRLTLPALTAALRAKPDGAAAAIAGFLTASDPRVRQDALNAMARLRAKESLDQVRKLLESDPDPLTRANAARVLGAAIETAAVDALGSRMVNDPDSRVRVAAIRALASIAQPDSGAALLKRGEALRVLEPAPINELREIATALGRVLANTNNEEAIALLATMRKAGPEVEMAFARIAPQRYLEDPAIKTPNADWQQVSAVAQGLAEIATLDKVTPTLKERAGAIVRTLALSGQTPERAMYDVLQALKAFKPKDLGNIAISKLKASDVITRAAAADILAELPPSSQTTKALSDAFETTTNDKQNDAALSIVGALGKAKDGAATAALLNAAKSTDHLVRRRAIDALKDREGVTVPTVGPAKSRNTPADYARAVSRIGKQPKATLTTDKGVITIQFYPAEAPLTVDSFIQLANAHFFDGLTFHRVVPNFVVQGGDPRGDGNGGPGYTIRCEINTVPYDAGAVGMALSGKDTGGSQFFITHSPQPHLDGGYTVFGQVLNGQEVVDKIERGDRIRTITIEE